MFMHAFNLVLILHAIFNIKMYVNSDNYCINSLLGIKFIISRNFVYPFPLCFTR